jgi:D-methionine transport system permease protein
MNQENLVLAWELMPLQFLNTLYMVFASAIFASLLGLPIGIILFLTDKGQLKEHTVLYKSISTIVNIGRSFPFAILMIALIPFTRWIVGTSLGTTAAIVPLSLAAAPFIARIVENSLKEIDRHLIEAVLVMGASSWQIIVKVLLPEALPSLVSGCTLTVINLIGYSAMAGLVGGGGLGQVAIQYGYNRFNSFIMVLTVIILLLIVEGVQWAGNVCIRSILKKRGRFHA